MVCMCGDTHCSSCGPAHGNSKCPICRAWADDGCEHFYEETGELKAEFQQEAERMYAAELAADIAYTENMFNDPDDLY
jgi:hypothetical protein